MNKTIFFSFLITTCLGFLNLPAQTALTTGLDKYSKQMQTLIVEQGYELQRINPKDINANSLAKKEVLALFNLHQTWYQKSYFDANQCKDILQFIKEGGALYITARQAYSNLLNQLGVTLEGNDGGTTGRDWPLIMQQATAFEEHLLTLDISAIATDVSARFFVDNNWAVLGKNDADEAMLVTRFFGKGKIVLCAGQRTFRDALETSNRYETDITQGDNYQFYTNLFQFFLATDIDCNPFVTHEKPNFSIAPNPTTSLVSVRGEGMEQIDILSSNGQLVKQVFVKNQIQIQIQIDMSGLPKGLYFFRITSLQGINTKEVILMD